MKTESGETGTYGYILELTYDDAYSLVFTSPAYFGFNRQGGPDSKFVIDTTTPFLVITDVTCDNCSDTPDGSGDFNSDDSQSFRPVSMPPDEDSITVGGV